MNIPVRRSTTAHYALYLSPAEGLPKGVLRGSAQVELHAFRIVSADPWQLDKHGLIIVPEYCRILGGKWKPFEDIRAIAEAPQTLLLPMGIRIPARSAIFIRKAGSQAMLVGEAECE